MSKWLSLGILLLLFTCSWCTPTAAASAPDPADDAYTGVLLSYGIPDSARDGDYAQGGHLFYGQPFGARMAWEVGIFALDLKRETNNDLDDYLYGLGPDLLFSLREDGFRRSMLNPFVLGGIGIFHDDSKRVRDTTGYLNVGLGLLIPSGSDRLRIRLEARYYGIFSDDAPSKADPAVSETDFGDAQISLGLQWALQSQVTQIIQAAPISDLDGDGVGDADDACPNTAPEVPVTANGCEADSDGDGVFNSRDRCPNTPAGVQVDAQGCPRDSDGDGVDDDQDRCPGTAAGAPVDAQGCERDDDRDGVVNRRDQCPNTPAGTEVDTVGCAIAQSCDDDCDQDGVPNPDDYCPGTLRGLTVDARGCVLKPQAITLDGVHFEFDRAEITDYSAEILDRVVETLRGQPGMRVLIEGHTDSQGSDAYNLSLSDRRAASVRAYLLAKGIAPARLASRGFGESIPIASNDTAEGRLKNRRVVFRVLEAGTSSGVQP